MKDWSKSNDYRKKYKHHYNIDFGRTFAIHHIDGDRKNNDITNLLLLPRELHAKYHFDKNILKCNTIDDLFRISGIYAADSRLFEMKAFLRASETVIKVNMWYDYKRYLDGEICWNLCFHEFERLIRESRKDIEYEVHN